MMRPSKSLLALALALLASSCDDGAPDADADADADADVDADVDADADSDVESDAETDADVADADDADLDVEVEMPIQIATRADGWLRGDLHQHTEWSDGDDPVATVIRIGEYLASEAFLAAHPEYGESGLDFIAVTDHNSVEAVSDPGWESSSLILVPGEELSMVGHVNLFGVDALVPPDPGGGEVTLEDVQAGFDAAHGQGALVSINHPFIQNYAFPWDVRDADAMEVWNTPWGLMSQPFSADDLAAWEAAHGPASPLFRRAIDEQGTGKGGQALVLYEAQLARGLHVALVGGSDRHALLMPGFPTTWVRAETPDLDGVLAGLRARHTFVSRGPAAAQVLVAVEVGDASYEAGDVAPVPSAGVSARVVVTVANALGGLVRVVSGGAIATDDELAGAALGSVVLEEAIDANPFTAEVTIDAAPGTWLYPVVLEPLVRPGLDADQEALVRDLAAGVLDTGVLPTGEMDVMSFANLVIRLGLIDVGVALGTAPCEPEEWSLAVAQCVPADDDGLASFFIPDYLDRALNVAPVDDAVSDWSMGAVGSAVRFVSE